MIRFQCKMSDVIGTLLKVQNYLKQMKKTIYLDPLIVGRWKLQKLIEETANEFCSSWWCHFIAWNKVMKTMTNKNKKDKPWKVLIPPKRLM